METQQTRTPKSPDCTPPWQPSLQPPYLLGLGAQRRREAETGNARIPHRDGPRAHGELETSHRDRQYSHHRDEQKLQTRASHVPRPQSAPSQTRTVTAPVGTQTGARCASFTFTWRYRFPEPSVQQVSHSAQCAAPFLCASPRARQLTSHNCHGKVSCPRKGL